jgi:hypothetical protein
MALTPTVYKSTDPGAPALTGQAGSLRDVLRAVLVTGYGSGGDAKAGAGWTEPFSGTNVSAFRNSAVTGTGGYLRVDDTSTYAGSNARSALMRAYEVMTDVDTGTGPTPTAAQVASGLLVPKSKTLDSTSRAWVVIANERFFYLFTDAGATASGWVNVAHFPFFAGDLISRKPGDAYHFCVIGSQMNAISGLGNAASGMFFGGRYSGAPLSSGVYLPRAQSQTGTSKAAAVCVLSDGETGYVIGGSGAYPDAVSGGLRMERVMVYEAAREIRGYLPNVYGTTCGRPFSDLSIRTDIEGVPEDTQILAKSFSQSVGAGNVASYDGQLLFDITNAWG